MLISHAGSSTWNWPITTLVEALAMHSAEYSDTDKPTFNSDAMPQESVKVTTPGCRSSLTNSRLLRLHKPMVDAYLTPRRRLMRLLPPELQCARVVDRVRLMELSDLQIAFCHYPEITWE